MMIKKIFLFLIIIALFFAFIWSFTPPLKYICAQNHRLMKKLIALISLLFIFVSCDFLSDLVNGGEDTSELDYTYSKDHIVGAQFRV